MKRRRQIRLHISLPLRAGIGVEHGRAILPVRRGDPAVVDENVDAVVEEFCGLLGGGFDLRDGAQVAEGGGEGAVSEEGVEVGFGGVG
jgi:hypothetical protein